jgi:hypothetical protein
LPRVARRFRFVLAALLVSGAAAAEAPPPEQQTLSAYEQQTLDEVLRERGGRLAEQAEGKLIESVEFVRLEVFDEHDPVPDFLNVFHATSVERVIRRELLFAAGEPFTQQSADETARNLRELRQLSLVLIVPVRGSAPDRVKVLVVTKDVWSLRLNSNFAIGDGGLSYLLLNPSEENVFGTHASVGSVFVLYPESYSLGLLTAHRKIAGTHLEGSASASLIWNRDSGDSEGSFGFFSYGQPLYSRDVEWAWGTAFYFRDEIYRLYTGDAVTEFDADATVGDDALPITFRYERAVGAYELIRSFGLLHKLDVSVGVEADRRYFAWTPPPGTLPAAAAEFRREELPISDTRASPFIQVRSYDTTFLTTLELETLGLQEDFRLGPSALVRLYPASTAVASTRDMLGTLAGLQYTLPLRDGLARATVANTYEYEFNGRHDALVEGRLRVASPRLGFGRLVADGVVRSRYQNYLRRRFYLGGDGRLRGYAPNAYVGPHVLAFNTELRTTSVDILSAQVGLAAFYDAGHAAEEFAQLNLKHAVGLGLRMLFPQANRSIFRFDWGLPLSLPGGPLPGGFFATFEQAFIMPELKPPTVTSFVAD